MPLHSKPRISCVPFFWLLMSAHVLTSCLLLSSACIFSFFFFPNFPHRSINKSIIKIQFPLPISPHLLQNHHRQYSIPFSSFTNLYCLLWTLHAFSGFPTTWHCLTNLTNPFFPSHINNIPCPERASPFSTTCFPTNLFSANLKCGHCSVLSFLVHTPLLPLLGTDDSKRLHNPPNRPSLMKLTCSSFCFKSSVSFNNFNFLCSPWDKDSHIPGWP